ncbi:MAG: tRNA (adenosine(37)-N6)-threonylcarbamoyltransferase complex dimerization subunit type 1 TsaB [Burkholderiales bacterium]|nr:tRNA (adenosine(37)-N6)-threonylcarbamoyltransferase complex dimerization subunit type 1 TsaB [Burkholderiales bacterium]
MRILAFDTSTEFCSCALWAGGEADEAVERAGQRHSSLLLPMAQRLLAHHGTRMDALDAIAFGAGPGSFTGLRIACSVAQGIAFARGLPVLPVSTLEALAEEVDGERVLAALDARMGELYLAAFRRSGDGWQTIEGPCLAQPQALPPLDGTWTGRGSGFAAHGAALAGAYRLDTVDAAAFPRARAVARIGARALAAGRTVAPEAAAPLYLRDKVALDVREQAAARLARGAR